MLFLKIGLFVLSVILVIFGFYKIDDIEEEIGIVGLGLGIGTGIIAILLCLKLYFIAKIVLAVLSGFLFIYGILMIDDCEEEIGIFCIILAVFTTLGAICWFTNCFGLLNNSYLLNNKPIVEAGTTPLLSNSYSLKNKLFLWILIDKLIFIGTICYFIFTEKIGKAFLWGITCLGSTAIIAYILLEGYEMFDVFIEAFKFSTLMFFGVSPLILIILIALLGLLLAIVSGGESEPKLRAVTFWFEDD